MINKSFQLLRTNPLLTTNIKLVVSSNYKLYLESFDSNKILSDTKYKHVILNKEKYLEDVVSEFYRDLPVNIAYDIKYDSDNDVMQSNFDTQFDDIYYSGAKNIEDQWHSEEFEYFAPLYIRPSSIPKNFIILRVDEPVVYKQTGLNYTVDSIRPDNFTDEILNKWKCVKVFDLSIGSDFGSFLDNNYVKNSRFPDRAFELDIKKNNFSRWHGMDFDSGIYTEKSLILNDKLMYENPDFNLEQFITNGYRDNKLIYPNILNIKFLFDDTPSTPDMVKKWSMNRYYGFYAESMERITNLTSYVTPTLKQNIKLVNNIFIKVGTTNENICPFVNGWVEGETNYIYIDNNLHRIERTLQNNSYVYKIVSDRILDSMLNIDNVYFNTINIQYDESNYRSYIQNDVGNFTIDSYVDDIDQELSMYGDLYLVDINGIYHVIKKDSNGRYYIQCDYAINSNSKELEYWVGGKSSSNYTKIDVYNKKDTTTSPLEYKLYRVKFSDIKDFDFDRVNTHFSDFDYEKNTYYDTTETKLHATEYRDISNPKSNKVHGINQDGQYKVMNVSSEYIASDELFEIKNNDLSEIWRKNQSICKWGYRDSVSHSDYPYKLNNNFKTGGVHNRITNIYSVEPNITDKNLDYFYRVGNFHDANLNSIFYYNQSSNISTDLLNSDHSSLFNIDMYMNSNVDYFTYFFNNKEKYYDNGKLYERQYEKYSIFNSGVKFENSSTLFKGMKFNIYGVDNFILENDTTSTISEILISDTKRYNDYKFSILLNDRYRKYDNSDQLVGITNGALYSTILNNPDSNGIHVFMNDKYKNVMVVVNVVVPIWATINSLNNVTKTGEKYGLYYAKMLNGMPIYSGTTTSLRYNPSIITAHNIAEALNNMNDKRNFDYPVTFYYVDENGNSGFTMVSDYTNSTLTSITSWGKKTPPFILNVDYPNILETKLKSYYYTPLQGPDYNIYDKYKKTLAQKQSRDYDIDDYLAREIKINENEIKPRVQQHKETIRYTNHMYRYSGSYEPIFKNIPLFNTHVIWSNGVSGINSNYKFDLNLRKFATIDEIIFSKVNRKSNLLRLNNAENDKSIYPMLDEFGYSYIDRNIFMSCWDKNYFIETVEPIGDEYSVIPLDIKLSVSNIGESSRVVTIVATVINNGNIARTNDVIFSYKTPLNPLHIDIDTYYSQTVDGNSTRSFVVNNFTINSGAYGDIVSFKVSLSSDEVNYNYRLFYPKPVANFTITGNQIVNQTLTLTATGSTNYTSVLWKLLGANNISSYTSPIITLSYGTVNEYNIKLIVSNPDWYDTEIKTVSILYDTIPNYTPVSTTIRMLDTVQFTYTGDPMIGYYWHFEGGTPSTSTQKNPLITYKTNYDSPYDVSLRTTTSNLEYRYITRSNSITVLSPIELEVGVGATPETHVNINVSEYGEDIVFNVLSNADWRVIVWPNNNDNYPAVGIYNGSGTVNGLVLSFAPNPYSHSIDGTVNFLIVGSTVIHAVINWIQPRIL